jgi:Ca2+-binding RTX toxin-like protein
VATYSGTAGDDVYSGGSEDDVIDGHDGNDTLSGGDGDDLIDGGAGDDIINGGDGDDLIDSGTGVDRADGGSGLDGLAGDLSALPIVWWNLNTGSFISNSPTASFTGFEYLAALITGPNMDQITTHMGAYDDDVTTGAGNDTVTVYNGHDTVRTGGAGEGNDTLIIDYSAATSDILTTGFGGTPQDGYSGTIGGADRSVTFTGVDIFNIRTGSGNDVIRTGFGSADEVYTNAGDDFVDLGPNGGSAFGGSGIDGISADLSWRTVAVNWNFVTGSFKLGIFGGLSDAIQQFEYIGTVTFGSGDDVIVTAGLDRDEVIVTGGGNDSVTVVHGLDQVQGGSGADTLTIDYRGATGSVVSGALSAGTDGYSGRVEAPDRAVDFTGIDRLVIMSGSGADHLLGGGGNDSLDGGSGADEMAGGAGNDLYFVDDAGDAVVENAGEGIDEVRTALAGYSLLGTEIENLTATSNAAHQFRGSAGNNVLTGLGGNDVLLLHDGGEDSAFGGSGNDVLYFGAALGLNDVADGGPGRDSVVLQGNVSVVLADYHLSGIESISIQSGANATFGDTANNFYDYSVTMANGNTVGPTPLIVNAQSLRAGEDFTFDGSAETDGRYLVYGGHGVDNLKGGAGVDVFFFEGQRWGAGDRVDGGAGRDSVVISAGNGLTHIEFAADALSNIESISVNATYATDPTQLPSYEFVLSNGNVAPGQTLIVNGFSLANASQTIAIDGSAVHDGKLILFGGAGGDVLIGGDGADQLYGAGSSDSLTGAAGADVFRYDSTSDSTASASDLIGDFLSGTDKVDLSRIDADTLAGGSQAFTWIGSSAFAGTGASSAGQLRVFQDGGGQWHAEGDTNGDGSADLVILFQPGTAAPVQGDFIL